MDSPLEAVAFSQLDGWAVDDHEAVLAVLRRSCVAILHLTADSHCQARFAGNLQAWQDVASAALTASPARQFFETQFQPYRVCDPERPEGLFTGYFEPEVVGSLKAEGEFCVPVYRPPADLVTFPEAMRQRHGLTAGRLAGGKPGPYFTRREIEQGALDGRGLEIVWLRDWADAFFIHIQGSGRIRLRQGGIMRLGYAAKSGLPYTSIGAVLADRGIMSREQLSMQSIREWMVQNPAEARALMWENQSFIFFQVAQLEDAGLGALGAQDVQLTPRRSLAVDRRFWTLGTPVWLDADVPAGDEGSMERFRQLLIAQDTGSAIRGLARGDVYWGFGDSAGRIAGPMKSSGDMYVLLPCAVAEELGLRT